MRRAVILLTLALAGCGGFTFQSNTLPANAITVTGLVSTVQLTVVNDGNGTLVNVTVVTLQQSGGTQTLTFCGTQSSQFPMNQNLRVSFVPANTCANLIVVVHV